MTEILLTVTITGTDEDLDAQFLDRGHVRTRAEVAAEWAAITLEDDNALTVHAEPAHTSPPPTPSEQTARVLVTFTSAPEVFEVLAADHTGEHPDAASALASVVRAAILGVAGRALVEAGIRWEVGNP